MAKKLSKKRIQQIRDEFQREIPTPEQLVASGDMESPVSRATFVAAWQAVGALKKARQEAGLSLSQVAARGGLDKGTLSRLEAGQHLNPTLDTLGRYALAVGHGLTLSFPLLPEEPEALSVDGKAERGNKRGCGSANRPKGVMSFDDIKRYYRRDWLPMSEFERFRSMASWEEAIEAAALSVDENGEVYDHQLNPFGKPVADFAKAAQALLGARGEIEACRSFDALLTLIERLLKRAFPPGSNKELYAYDVAFRIAAYADGVRSGMLPSRVYLHCGTRKGVEALGIQTKGRKSISISELPPELQSLPPWQLEDVLCIYAKNLPKNWRQNS